jgi:cellulose synthase/poly-beta-1,6-N-acetylglucosamine synthase-like glycosyltransferase
MLDCGTEPRQNAFYKLIKEFVRDRSQNVGGVCGEIRVRGPEDGED